MWIGGLSGAGKAAANTKHTLDEFRNDPKNKSLLSYARKWYWFHLLVSPVLLLMLLLFLEIVSHGSSDLIIPVVIFVVLAPTINCLIAALFTAMLIRFKIKPEALRDHINRRNWAIFFGSLRGYLVGLVLSLIIGLFILFSF